MINKPKKSRKIIGFTLLGVVIIPVLLAVFSLWIYQSEIIQYVKTEIHEQYGLKINIKSSEIRFFSDWPNASLQLKEIDAKDTLPNFSDKPFLKAEEIHLSLNLINLMFNKIKINSITIKKAKVQIWVDSLGQSNVSFLTSDDPKSNSSNKNEGFKFKNIKLSDIHFIYMNEEKDKAIDLEISHFNVNVKRKDDIRTLLLDANVLVNRLAFDTQKGDFIKGKNLELKAWKGNMSTDFRSFDFNEAPTIIDQHFFDLGLAIQTQGEGLFGLKIKTQKLDRTFALSLLTNRLQKKIARFYWTGLIDVYADIKIPLKPGYEPTVSLTAHLSGSDFKLANHDILLEAIVGSATITIPGDSIYSGDMTKATVVGKIDKAILKKWPITGNLLIENFENPILTSDASLNIPANVLNSGKVNGPWSGTANLEVDLKLPLKNVTSSNWMDSAQKCNIKLQSTDISYQIKNKKPIRLALLAYLNTKVLNIKQCKISHENQSILATGEVSNFMRKVLNEEDNWISKLKIKSDHIKLEKWLDNIKQITEVQPAKTSDSNKQKLDDIDLEVDVKKLSFKYFVATEVKGQLLIKPWIAEIKNLSLNTCNGKMQTDIVWKNSKKIEGKVSINQAQVNAIFKNFNNFDQTVLKADQLEGDIDVSANFSIDVDADFNFVNKSLSADIELLIANGQLKNFGPLMKISKYVFKNRNLDLIEFADLKQNLRFDGTQMNIELFEINSTAFWMYLEGIYDFDGESDLRLQIPWGNLKKIPDDAIVDQHGEEGRQANSLFLKATGSKDNLSITYDQSLNGKRAERKELRRLNKKMNKELQKR